MMDHVVFPSALDQRLDLNAPDRFDAYYGMADYRIAAARLMVPEALPVPERRRRIAVRRGAQRAALPGGRGRIGVWWSALRLG